MKSNVTAELEKLQTDRHVGPLRKDISEIFESLEAVEVTVAELQGNPSSQGQGRVFIHVYCKGDICQIFRNSGLLNCQQFFVHYSILTR